jgi:hypothetical protein
LLLSFEELEVESELVDVLIDKFVGLFHGELDAGD